MTEMSAAEAAVVARFDAAEPAPESWRGDDGLREAVAEAIFDHHPMSRWGAENLADAVLALPEVAALRAKAAATDRVRELHRPWRDGLPICNECSDEIAVGWPCDTIEALDGPSPC